MSIGPIRFVAVHPGAGASLAADAWLSGPQELTACHSAAELLQRLQELYEHRHGEVAAATAQGRNAGYAAGRDEALGAVAPQLLDAWEQAATHARMDVQTWRQAAVALSCHIVQHIAGTMAPADVVSALALRAADALAPGQAAVVRVHPDVAAAVAQHLTVHQQSTDTALLEVRADPALEPLDCRFDMPCGQWFVGLEPQLDKAVQAMLHANAHTTEAVR